MPEVPWWVEHNGGLSCPIPTAKIAVATCSSLSKWETFAPPSNGKKNWETGSCEWRCGRIALGRSVRCDAIGVCVCVGAAWLFLSSVGRYVDVLAGANLDGNAKTASVQLEMLPGTASRRTSKQQRGLQMTEMRDKTEKVGGMPTFYVVHGLCLLLARVACSVVVTCTRVTLQFLSLLCVCTWVACVLDGLACGVRCAVCVGCGVWAQFTQAEGMDDDDNNVTMLNSSSAAKPPKLWWWGQTLCLPCPPRARKPHLRITASKHSVFGQSTLDLSAALALQWLQAHPGDPVAWWVAMTPGPHPKVVGKTAETAAAIKEELENASVLASVTVTPPPQVLLAFRFVRFELQCS